MKYLHTIVLLDLETNHTYKRIVIEATQASIEHREISPEKYIRPQRSVVAHRINWILVFDYQQYIQQYFYLDSLDLKICYDRIVQSATSLAL